MASHRYFHLVSPPFRPVRIYLADSPSLSFSHHRVSLPPPDWIRAAHRHGTKILGTLIFEWDAGRQDIVLLTLGDRPHRREAFEEVSLEVADQLVELAVERGFDGWLVNVEVELGLENGVGATEHARALLVWLQYLRSEVAKRVPGGEVMW